MRKIIASHLTDVNFDSAALGGTAIVSHPIAHLGEWQAVLSLPHVRVPAQAVLVVSLSPAEAHHATRPPTSNGLRLTSSFAKRAAAAATRALTWPPTGMWSANMLSVAMLSVVMLSVAMQNTTEDIAARAISGAACLSTSTTVTTMAIAVGSAAAPKQPAAATGGSVIASAAKTIKRRSQRVQSTSGQLLS